MDSNLQELRKKYPWPDERPDGKNHHRGWMSKNTKIALQLALDRNMNTTKGFVKGGIVLELGVFYGKSARWWLRRGFDHVICNDIFKAKWAGPTHYEDFLHSCWDVRDKFTPLKMPSQEALVEVARHEVPVDLVYIDACHDFNCASADIILAHRLFPNSFIVGDDWNFMGDAVEWTSWHCKFLYEVMIPCWWITNDRPQIAS